MCNPAAAKVNDVVGPVSSTALFKLKEMIIPLPPDWRMPNMPFPSLALTNPFGALVSSMSGSVGGVRRARKLSVTPSLSRVLALVTPASAEMLCVK